MTGGYFYQYGGRTDKIIYFMDQMNESELNSTFHIINYFINDKNHANYSTIVQMKNQICHLNILVKEFSGLRHFSIDYVNYLLNPNKLGLSLL